MKLSASPPTRSARLLRGGRMVPVYAATIYGVRHCQHEGLAIDVEAMESYADAALLLLRDACAAYAWRARRRAMAR